MIDFTLTDSQTPPPEGLAFDEIVERALNLCARLPDGECYAPYRRQLAELSERLAGGRLHLAVLGQFNRGKSTFINALLGLPILPVSVLPVTSAPTIIVHGSHLSCTVEFLNGRAPVRIDDSPQSVRDVLLEYVAESNNPQNKHGVSRVTVTCDSAMLRHGTMLIDTPGFGSTHVHNTTTTRRLIEGCDAALFLLSADLPITQVEVDFLREIRTFVPRIFFVYNKIDILSEEELRTTSEYIRAELIDKAKFSDDIFLFPIAAKHAQGAGAQDESDEKWLHSGMEKIRSEVVDFMLREKYFALAEALDGKCRAALDGILSSLNEERVRLAAPLAALRTEVEQARCYLQRVKAEIEQTRECMSGEERDVCTQFEELCATRTQHTHDAIERALDSLAQDAAQKAGTLRFVLTSAARVIDEILGRLFVQLAAAINQRMHERVSSHTANLLERARHIEHDIGCIPAALRENTDRTSGVELDTSVSWKPDIPLDTPSWSWAQDARDRMRTRTARHHYYTRTLLPLLHAHTEACLQKLQSAAQEQIHRVLSVFAHNLLNDYSLIDAALKQWCSDKENALEQQSQLTQPALESLDNLAEEFGRIRNSLV